MILRGRRVIVFFFFFFLFFFIFGQDKISEYVSVNQTIVRVRTR